MADSVGYRRFENSQSVPLHPLAQQTADAESQADRDRHDREQFGEDSDERLKGDSDAI